MREQDLRLIVCLVGLGLSACASTRGPATAPNPSPARAAPGYDSTRERVYVVEPGEALGRIATCAGLSVDQLARRNKIADPDRVAAGTALMLPADHRCTHERTGSAPERDAGDLLTRAQERLDAADFDGALALAGSCVEKLSTDHPDPKTNSIRARCHVVAGTAATGLDRRERAIEEFRRALALDPHLELASETTSPRVRELMDLAKSEAPPDAPP